MIRINQYVRKGDRTLISRSSGDARVIREQITQFAVWIYSPYRPILMDLSALCVCLWHYSYTNDVFIEKTPTSARQNVRDGTVNLCECVAGD